MGFFRSLFDGQHGLVYANVRAYFTARTKGSDHSRALTEMVFARYPSAEFTRGQVLERMEESAGSGDSPEEQLRSVIHLMHSLEVGLPADYDVYRKLHAEMDEVIARHKRKHPGLL